MLTDTAAEPALNALLRGALAAVPLALIVALLSRVLPTRLLPASTRAWLWWLVCLRSLLIMTAPPPLDVALLPSLFSAGSESGYASALRPVSPFLPVSNASKWTPQDAAAPVGKAASDASAVPVTTVAATALPPQQEWSPLPLLFSTLFALWFAGTLAILLGTLWQFWRVWRIVSRAQPAQAPMLTALMVEAALRARLPHSPFLMITRGQTDPFATGLRQPVLVFSDADLENLSPDELRLILAHEMAHLRRGDLRWGLLPLVARMVFWFSPITHWICREYDAAREAACDESALRATGASPSAYGRLLLKLGPEDKMTRRGYSAAALPVGSPYFALLQHRMGALSSYQPTDSWRMGRRLCTLAALVTVALGILPWRLVAAGQGDGDLSSMASRRANRAVNLNFTRGLEGWSLVQASDEVQGFQTPTHFAAATDAQASRPGGDSGPAVRIVTTASTKDTVILGQNVAGRAYAGKRMRFSAYIKTQNLQRGAGLWLRLDTDAWQKNWAYNAGLGAIRGTTDWKRYDFVFDVPVRGASGFAFGIEQAGAGTLLVDDVTLEEVSPDTPITPASWDSRGPAFLEDVQVDLTNGDFEDGLRGWTPGRGDGHPATDVLVGVQRGKTHTGRSSAFLSTRSEENSASRILSQTFQMKRYAGQTVRVSAYLRPQLTNAKSCAGIWIRIDGKGFQQAWNRKGGILIGTRGDWQRVQYTLHVPEEATVAEIGVNLIGPGKVSADNITIQPVTGPEAAYLDTPDYDSTANESSH